MVSSFKKSSEEISSYIDELKNRVFSSSELNEILEANREEWSLVKSVGFAYSWKCYRIEKFCKNSN